MKQGNKVLGIRNSELGISLEYEKYALAVQIRKAAISVTAKKLLNGYIKFVRGQLNNTNDDRT